MSSEELSLFVLSHSIGRERPTRHGDPSRPCGARYAALWVVFLVVFPGLASLSRVAGGASLGGTFAAMFAWAAGGERHDTGRARRVDRGAAGNWYTHRTAPTARRNFAPFRGCRGLDSRRVRKHFHPLEQLLYRLNRVRAHDGVRVFTPYKKSCLQIHER